MQKTFLALTLATFVTLPAGLADHAQPLYPDSGGSPSITFDHRAGNEWWVEVNVTHSESYGTFSVLARSEKGDWHYLELRSWGNWAASFRIPPGERVQFQAYQPGGMSDVWRATSCFFTHPAGQEQCAPGDTDAYRVEWRNPSGNEWWVQVFPHSNRPVTWAYVLVYTVDGWSHAPLKKQSWGGWATSTRLPQGSTVRFLGGNAAESSESGCYRWTSARVIDCPPDYGPSGPGSFMTRFDHAGGNEWWVETKLGPVPARQVLAQDEGGPWVPLQYRSWGNWAGSFHIEPGHKVHFRALFDYETRESCWFTHPSGFGPDGETVCESTYVQ